ncbi:ubiquinone/menaquinone biosynthesis methyltransferase [Kiritimatiellota bacterium B12222]|nr:ubiquinone/menaquinone biosynthesis methyltransferase [Kiritimatiellota bacterium B12222]
MTAAIFSTPESKRSYNRSLFKEVAPQYDRVTRVLSFGQDASWKKWLLKQLPSDNPHEILDLACGTGDLTRALATQYPHAHVTGLDLTPEMLTLAQGPHQITWQEGDMCDLDIADHSIDVVTGGYALRNAPDLETCIQEISRVLRPGGTAAFLDFSAPVNPWLRKLHFGLLWIWGAIWGTCFHGKPSVYTYIADSLARFPDHKQLRTHFATHHLIEVTHRRYMMGMIEIIVFKKD